MAKAKFERTKPHCNIGLFFFAFGIPFFGCKAEFFAASRIQSFVAVSGKCFR